MTGLRESDMWSHRKGVLLGIILFVIVAIVGPLIYLYQKGSVENYSSPIVKVDSLRTHVLNDLIALSQAIEAYYAKNLRYPERLDQVQPEFIDKIPLEPGTQKPYTYKLDPHNQYQILLSDPNIYGYKELRIENGKIIKNE